MSSLVDVRIPRVLFWFSWLKTDRYPDFSNHIYLLMIGWMNIVNNYHMNHMMTCHLFKVLENLPFEPFKEAISQKIWVLNHRVIESFRGSSRLWKQYTIISCTLRSFFRLTMDELVLLAIGPRRFFKISSRSE